MTAPPQKSAEQLESERKKKEMADARVIFEDSKAEIYLHRQQKNFFDFVKSLCTLQTNINKFQQGQLKISSDPEITAKVKKMISNAEHAIKMNIDHFMQFKDSSKVQDFFKFMYELRK